MTGHHPDHNDVYAFFHLVYGQVKPVMEVMDARGNGFQKRLSLVLKTQPGCVHDPDECADAADAFFKSFFSWMAREVLCTESKNHSDSFASLYMRSAESGIRDFVDAHPDLGSWLEQKLLYWDSDVCKAQNCAMRMVQFCRSLTSVEGSAASHTRTTFSAEETVYGFHYWERQVYYHAALYRTYPNGGVSGSDGIGGPGPGSDPVPARLSEVDCVKKWILEDRRFGPGLHCSSNARVWVKNKMKKGSQTGELVQNALKDLGQICLVSLTTQKKKGHATTSFQKRTRDEVLASPEAVAELQRLRLSIDLFPEQ